MSEPSPWPLSRRTHYEPSPPTETAHGIPARPRPCPGRAVPLPDDRKCFNKGHSCPPPLMARYGRQECLQMTTNDFVALSRTLRSFSAFVLPVPRAYAYTAVFQSGVRAREHASRSVVLYGVRPGPNGATRRCERRRRLHTAGVCACGRKLLPTFLFKRKTVPALFFCFFFFVSVPHFRARTLS